MVGTSEAALARFEDPGTVFILVTPPDWSFDASGAADGVFIAVDQEPWDLAFHPNIVVTQLTPDPQDPAHGDSLLSHQQSLEAGLTESLQDYRLLHLDADILGVDETQAVMRSASYTSEDGVPVMLHQWIARRGVYEISLSITFPTADLPSWSDASWMIAWSLEWKD